MSIQFGAGQIICPSRYFALEEMKIVVSMVVKNFDIVEIQTPEEKKVEEKLTFNMGPVELRMKLMQRGQERVLG